MPVTLPSSIFGMQLRLEEHSSLNDELPRTFNEFELLNARLGTTEGGRFLLAVSAHAPSPRKARALDRAVRERTQTPLVLYLDHTDSKALDALVSESIAFIAKDGNVYLPFAGVLAKPSRPLPEPKMLSPQAQRIILNLISGAWDKCTASDLAGLCGRSNASITKYLSEIEAILPRLITTSWKLKTLANPGMSTEELLDHFEPYLASPVAKRIRLAASPGIEVLARYGACFSGESALAFFSDLAFALTPLTVMMEEDKLKELQNDLGDDWRKAPWYSDAELIIETWTYPLDARPTKEFRPTGLPCVDPYSLYAEFLRTDIDDPRLLDAIGQLREELCR